VIKGNWMREACNTHGRGEKMYRILTGNPKRIMVINTSTAFTIMVLLLLILIKQQNNYYY